ncbi:adenylyltransferase/cytidyltransferase family protein [Bacteroides cellulosilyticus]|uniref:adenylyltransferase/cytidyltransferase family protein n=1 Tax=Bacteroides cellulosilyticus TaxID=246787 RepID=UPI001C378AF1|nr:adenylyltransferase/cytidyltransferase family protein [Bacteroides cellulosilyticus]MBV3639762.1 adenylyltransferase/cytidyltransferase family protein [Bacteroides cellulosilyticus]MBV3665783.1 adenylyltransferase/cytidyltransferase family protein [Bacteroides cellulosilyticus]MBV3687263.1 adenylyltransferase/cytidyltransferase family protein [Bacteroides cellulosilyticus]MBV3696607.1 adenylyltransferase/cytidyltransferase family protein [Bacteroides cellulosilyticus]MBV3710173.1 adenylyltr
MKRYKIGYTQGTYDMFHIGHLNLLNHAKEYCDYLIVGINSDMLVTEYKHKVPIINEFARYEIIKNIKAVDNAFLVNTLDKAEILKNVKFDAIFIGDDWRGNQRWIETERELSRYDIDVVYLPHTEGISTTLIRTMINK